MSLLNWSRLSSVAFKSVRSHVEIDNSPSLAGHSFGELCSIFVYAPILVSPDEPPVYG
jgi:hypothetical protein